MPLQPKPFDVTVVIPTYNYGKFLARAVNSVLHQAGQHQPNVIVIDDGSADDTAAVAAAFGDRIHYIRQSNQGVSVARNRGVQQAQTEWILFLDADDRLLPETLNHFSASIELHPAAYLHFGGYVSLGEDGSRHKSKRQPSMRDPLDNFSRFIQRQFTISTGTACYRRDVFQKIRYPAGMTHGEHIVVDGQVLANYPAAVIPHPLAEILDHPGRTRENIAQLIRCGASTVEAMFDPDILPAEAMQFKSLFLARWNLTLARACYRAHDFRQARRFYEQAFRNRWTSMCQITHGVRYLNSVLRAA